MGREELIAALEAATGPSRELDEAIGVWLHNLTSERRAIHMAFAKSYTSSLDAALTLVPEGWGATIMTAVGAAVVAELPDWDRDRASRHERGEGSTPAIALCIAALKAHAA